MKMQNILVPTDFSTNSLKAFEFAQHLAQQNNAILHVLHIVEPVSTAKDYDDEFNLERYEQARFLYAEEELRRFIFKNAPSKVEIVESLLIGKPHEQILKYTSEKEVDVIILASHGWTGLTHILMGSVANKVVRYADVPVICIKANSTVNLKDSQAEDNTFAENWVG